METDTNFRNINKMLQAGGGKPVKLGGMGRGGAGPRNRSLDSQGDKSPIRGGRGRGRGGLGRGRRDSSVPDLMHKTPSSINQS